MKALPVISSANNLSAYNILWFGYEENGSAKYWCNERANVVPLTCLMS
jgi:hypothetical protein